MDCSGFVTVGVFTQTVEFAGPQAPCLCQQVPAERPVAELGHVDEMGSRGHDDCVDPGDGARADE